MRIPFVGLVCLLCAAACAQQGNIALDVVVNDKSGKPVAGLQEKDFQILDDKRPQPILSFQAMSGGSEPVNILIVVDAVNVGFERIGYERDQIRRFLLQNDGKLPRPVSIAVLSDSGLRMGPEGSSDGRRIWMGTRRACGRLPDRRGSTGLRSVWTCRLRLSGNLPRRKRISRAGSW